MVTAGAAAPDAFAQIAVADENPVVIDFQTFQGAGFAPTPSAGQLDSDEFAIAGLSDGDVGFGGTGTSGDFARGVSAGSETTGGVYGYNDGLNAARWLFIQPSGSDFTPGTLTVRFENTNPSLTITTLEIEYSIKVYNDQARANSFNLAYTENCSGSPSYTSVGSLDYTSPEAADGSPAWTTIPRSTTLVSLNIPPGQTFCLQFSSADVSGSGSRDEIGIDDISVAATNLPVELQSFSAD
jgi:hypothetical protein